MEIIIIVAVIFIIYKIVRNKKRSSPSIPTTSIIGDSTLEASFLDRSNHMPIKDCQSYYKTLRECYEKFGNTMFDTNILISFLHGYSIDAYMGLTIGDVKRDLEKIARGEPDSNLSAPSADSLISLLASWDKHENLMEIADLNSYYKTLREYYAKYGKDMLNLDVIMRFSRTYQLDNRLQKSARDIQKDLETIANGDELPNENLPIYKTKRWKEIINDFSDIYDAKDYIDILEMFYYSFLHQMFDKDVVNEFIRTYQLDTKFNIGYRDVMKDLNKIHRQFKEELSEERARKKQLLSRIIKENGNTPIHDYKSYMEVLKQFYLEYGDDMFFMANEFINTFYLDSKFNIQPDDVLNDLEEIKKTANTTPKQPNMQVVQPSKNKQKPITTTNATLSKQTLNKQPTTVTVSYTIDYFITLFKDDDFCIDELVGVPQNIKKELTKYTAIGSWLSDKEALRIIEVFNNDVTFHKIFMEGAFMMSFTIKEKEQYQKLHFSMIFITTPESKERVFSKEIQYRIDDKDYKTMESSLTLRKQGVDDKYNLGNLQDYVERVKIDNLNGRRIKI